MEMSIFGHPLECAIPLDAVAAPYILVSQTRLCKIFRGRGDLSRRLNPASFALTVRPLSQARPVDGLHRVSPVPFRGSYFTLHRIVQRYAPTAHRLLV